MFTFIKKIFRNTQKSYLTLLVIMTVLASFEFCSLAIYSSVNALNLEPFMAMTINILPTISTFIALVFSVFIIKYFIENKKQEFAVLLLSGRSPKDLFVYIVVQFGLIACLSFIIGIGGGQLCMKIIQMICTSLSVSFQFHYSFITTIFIYVCFLCLTILFDSAICAHQFVMIDKDLVNYLSQRHTNEKSPYKISLSAMSSLNGQPTKKRIPFFSIIQSLFILGLTVYSCYALIRAHLDLENVYLYYLLALSGMEVIVNATIPMLYDVCHSLLIKHPILINALASFNDFSSTMITLVNLNALLIPTMAFIVIMSGQNLFLQVVVIPCFVMTLIMCCLSFILRYYFYEQHIRQHIAIYHAIGYNNQKLQSILLIKNILFAILGIILPLMLFVILVYKAFLENYLSLKVGLYLSILYIVLYLCILIYMFMKEKRMLMEVTNHVKYLNRCE